VLKQQIEHRKRMLQRLKMRPYRASTAKDCTGELGMQALNSASVWSVTFAGSLSTRASRRLTKRLWAGIAELDRERSIQSSEKHFHNNRFVIAYWDMHSEFQRNHPGIAIY
jgi:hypothetical protein